MKTLVFFSSCIFFQEKGQAKYVIGLSIVHLTGKKILQTQNKHRSLQNLCQNQIFKIFWNKFFRSKIFEIWGFWVDFEASDVCFVFAPFLLPVKWTILRPMTSFACPFSWKKMQLEKKKVFSLKQTSYFDEIHIPTRHFI